jgi:hypothetical protein
VATLTTRVERAIYTRLSEDADLLAALAEAGAVPNVEALYWRGMAELDTPPPFVVFDLLAAVDTPMRCGTVDSSELTYQIKAVGIGHDAQALEAAVDRLAALFDGYRVVSDGLDMLFARTGEVSYVEGAATGGYAHLGFQYTIRVQED